MADTLTGESMMKLDWEYTARLPMNPTSRQLALATFNLLLACTIKCLPQENGQLSARIPLVRMRTRGLLLDVLSTPFRGSTGRVARAKQLISQINIEGALP